MDEYDELAFYAQVLDSLSLTEYKRPIKVRKEVNVARKSEGLREVEISKVIATLTTFVEEGYADERETELSEEEIEARGVRKEALEYCKTAKGQRARRDIYNAFQDMDSGDLRGDIGGDLLPGLTRVVSEEELRI